MFASLFRKTTVAALAVLALGTATSHLRAGEPVVRTFGFLAGFVGTDDVPNFVGEGSTAVTALPCWTEQQITLRFSAYTDPDDLFDNSVWHSCNAHHAVVGGSPDGLFFWLSNDGTPNLPPIGAHTFTGPDSPLILYHEVFFIRLCANGSCDPGDDGSKWQFTTPDRGIPFVIVTAIFSK